jgi:hypothetical protein
MPTIGYRVIPPHLPPRRTKLDVPGWAGAPEPRADGSHEQPWHCIPFSEAARGGIELLYPFPQEVHVTKKAGLVTFELYPDETPDPEAPPPPFRPFGTDYYSYQSLIDLKVDAAYAIKTETHPRFYTDTTNTVPIAVPALIRPWWPMIYFMIFKAPAEGQTHIFRQGEAFMQISFVAADETFELVPMSEDEAAERELQSRRIHASRDTLTKETRWLSSTNTVFDGTYRRLAGAAKALKKNS